MKSAKPVLLRLRARQDIQVAVAWYRREAPHVANAFIDALEQTVNRIRRMPKAFSTRFARELDWPGLRSVGLEGFNWSVFFLVQPQHTELLRVLHPSRDLAELFDEDDP